MAAKREANGHNISANLAETSITVFHQAMSNVVNDEKQRVVKNKLGFFKIDAVLFYIKSIFSRIVFKSQLLG